MPRSLSCFPLLPFLQAQLAEDAFVETGATVTTETRGQKRASWWNGADRAIAALAEGVPARLCPRTGPASPGARAWTQSRRARPPKSPRG